MAGFDVSSTARRIIDTTDAAQIEDMLVLKRGEVEKIKAGVRELTQQEAQRIVSLFFSKLDADDEPVLAVKYSAQEYLNAVEYYEYRQQILREARRAVQQVIREDLRPILWLLVEKALTGDVRDESCGPGEVDGTGK